MIRAVKVRHMRQRNICTLCICLANVEACCKYLSISALVTNAESYLILAKSFATCANDKSNFKSYYGADNKFAQLIDTKYEPGSDL